MGEEFSFAGTGKPRAEGETASAAEEATESTALDNSVLMLCGRDAWLSLVPGPVRARLGQRVENWMCAQLGHGLVRVIDAQLSRGHLQERIRPSTGKNQAISSQLDVGKTVLRSVGRSSAPCLPLRLQSRVGQGFP